MSCNKVKAYERTTDAPCSDTIRSTESNSKLASYGRWLMSTTCPGYIIKYYALRARYYALRARYCYATLPRPPRSYDYCVLE